ncbi:MAG: alpha/beta hydrolase, partial [Chloroflexaceae bacterium]
LALLTWGRRAAWSGPAVWRRGILMAVAAALLVVGYVFLSFGLPTHLFVLNYFPPPPRWPVFLAVFAAMLPYFLADERLTRGAGAPRGAYALTKGAFFGGLILAIVLNPRELFFLVLIAPLFLVYFMFYGLLSGLIHRRTGTVVAGALVNAVLFAWIVAATFPLT